MHPTQSLLFFAVTSALATAGISQHTIRSMTGDQAGANFGRTLAVVEDVDGDGLRDLIVGEPNRDFGASTDSGAAALVRTGAWVIRSRTFGSQFTGHLGGSVAGLGDVDGDTIPDWACGSPGSGLGLGMVRVLSGANGLQLFEVSGEVFSQFGSAICSIGDRNNDGRADFAVGAPVNTATTPNGVVRFYSGVNGALLNTLNGGSNTLFGRSLATIGDYTGDGQPEIAIGEPGADINGTDSGRVSIKNPRDGLTNSWYWQSGAAAFPTAAQGGGAMAAIGDTNGDGKTDIAVATGGNLVCVLSGLDGAVLLSIANTEFGTAPSLTALGDWDGDGYFDIAIGAPTANFGAGRVFIYRMVFGAPLVQVLEGVPASTFGMAVAGLGDLDGDGRSELAVGAPTYALNGLIVGRVSVHSYDILATTTTFGQGCPGSNGVPSLYFSGTPNVGESFNMLCGNLRQNAFGYLLFGLSNAFTGNMPLPIALSSFGLPGCSLYVSTDAPEAFATGSGTLLTRSMTLPNTPSLATFQFYVQACQFDAGAIGGVTFSNAGSVHVGNL